MPKKVFAVKIMGENWEVQLLSGKEFKALFGSETVAMCCYNETRKQIYFRPSGVSMSTCVHETFHAFRSYQLTDNVEISADDMEEICADILAWHYRAIIRVARKIYKELTK